MLWAARSAAHDCEAAEIGRRLAQGQVPGKYPGRVLFADHAMPVEAAAFINSTMIRNFDFNDRFPGGHPSDCLGALLAFAGASAGSAAGTAAVDGGRFLAAMIVAYETFARLSDGAKLSRKSWDQGHAVGISTAAAACNLLGVSFEATVNAVGIAAASIVPLRVTRSGELTPWKNVATSFAMRSGLFAALLAAEGMAGPGNAFEGRDGLWEKVTGPFELAPFPNEGGEFMTPRVQIKYWPVETNAQPVVWAALELREKLNSAGIGGIEAIAEIEVFTSRFAHFEIGSEPEKWDPQTRETADHSLPYIFARTLMDGPIGVKSFAIEAVRDTGLRPLMAKIKVTVDDAVEALPPDAAAIHATIRSGDGGALTVEVANPLGHPDNPMGDAHIEEKFLALGAPVIGEDRCRTALDGWWRVAGADDLRPLNRWLDIQESGRE